MLDYEADYTKRFTTILFSDPDSATRETTGDEAADSRGEPINVAEGNTPTEAEFAADLFSRD